MDLTDWAPSDEDLNMVINVLQDSLVPDSDIQKKVQEHLQQMYRNPCFANYLLYILRNKQLYEEHIRSLSAIILKNNILTNFETFSQEILNCIRYECFNLLIDTSNNVRSSVTTLIGTLLWKGELSNWPDLIPKLCTLLDSSDEELSDTALTTLFKICEEYMLKRGISKEDNSSSVNILIAKFIELIPEGNCVIRKKSLKFLNQIMRENNDDKIHFDSKTYMNNLILILNDNDTEVQKLICQAFVIFVEMHNPCILTRISIVIEYVLSKNDNSDEDVALQACEFWLSLSKVDVCVEVITPFIGRLLPILLKNMKYSSEELNGLKSYVGIDEHLEDKCEDVRPFHSRIGMQYENNLDNDCDGNGDTYEETDAVGDPCLGWTLRKCSAASLDSLAVRFGDDLLPYFFNSMSQSIISEDFLVQESGILALGAIAEGCKNGLKPYLPKLFQYLYQYMNSEYSLIRVITCWTISRYMTWLMDDQFPMECYFIPTMMALLKHVLDGNKRVQRASLSAFCVFQEEARLKLLPYVEFILQTFSLCFDKFKFRSFLLLYDAIGVLAHSIGSYLNKPEYIQLLLPPLLHKFETAQDFYDDQFMALMECLSNIAIALELNFLPFTEVVFQRCLLIIGETITSIQCHSHNPLEYDFPDRDPICVAHEMLLCLALAVKSHLGKFVADSSLIPNLYYTLQDKIPQVRQPALALYGELVKNCFYLLAPTVHDYIPIIIENLDMRYEPVCNNAAWVVGKLCLAMGDGMGPYAEKIFIRFCEIMETANGTKTMYQTVAISLCTLGLICPQYVTPHLSLIIKPCCQAMRNIGDCEEKDIGFRGLCELIVRNPQAIVNDFIYFCDAVASFEDVKCDVKEAIKNILLCFQNHFQTEFPKCPQSLLAPLIKIIIEEVRGLCRKQTLACGFSPSSNAYDPLKLMHCVVTKTNEICLRYLDNSKLCSLPSPGPPYNAVSVCAIKNSRRRMEDRHVIIHDLNTLFIDEEVSPSSYYAIFDGHAGQDAAAYSCAHLHQFLGESKYFISNPEQALRDAFLKTDTLFNDKSNLENFRSGTTALCALLKPKEKNLYIAWVGDSQAVLVSQGQCIQCVQPHKPCREDEKLRIEQEGGTVMYWGTWRVNGQLAVSRAIGDVEYKPYVTAVPDIIEIPLTGLEDFLVLACDGLWDVMTEKDAARHVYEKIIQNPGDIEGVSQHLVQLAKENGSCDNISVIVVFLREPSKVVEEAHWATRHNIIMDTLDNANATNPFAISNNGDIQNKEDYVMNLGESFKQNATETMEFLSATNGKRSAHEFDEDDDLGPETDVDAIDDVLIGTTVMATKSLMEEIVMKNSSLCEQEKATLETDNDLIKQHVDYLENNYHMREDTPPADSVDLAGGFHDNVAESGDESEEEWDYIKGDQAEKENVDPSQNDKEICELTSDLDNMSQLNPNAAEFVPISPNRTTASPSYEKLMDDFVIAQSPKRGPNNDHDINVPNLQEFETEIKLRPSEIQECATKDDANDSASALTSQEIMENLLNGKDIDEIEFQPNSTPIKFANTGEFHFGPNSTPFLPAGGFMDQSEVLSTKAVVGEDSTYLEDNLNDSQISNKESDPMSMSFYQEKDDSDLNKVQVLPENIDDFLEKPKEEEENVLIDTTSPEVPKDNALDVILNSSEKESEPVLKEENSVCFESSQVEENSLVDVTISDLPEHNPLESACIQSTAEPDILESSIITAEFVPELNTNLEEECARSPILDAQSPD
ncbi:hypothetical protein FQR65_LT06555 [Abscondita terminalis]|nr:hypothetical protein FQR65_LT06555 [Abscondita terminalis]